jgi:hypothetical protein
MERRDVFTQRGIRFNQHAYLGKEKHSREKKERKNIHFLFVEKGFYERILGEIIALPHAK